MAKETTQLAMVEGEWEIAPRGDGDNVDVWTVDETEPLLLAQFYGQPTTTDPDLYFGVSYEQALAHARLFIAGPALVRAVLRIKEICSEETGLSVSGAVLDQIEEVIADAIAKATGAPA